MFDRLDEMFKLQLNQQKNWLDINSLTDEERDDYIRDLELFMIDEIMEYAKSRRFKRHKIWEEPYPRSTRIMELIDVQKYLLTAAIAEGVTAYEWHNYFLEKTKIVDERWKQDQAKWSNEAGIICCDIDDVLADYKTLSDGVKSLIDPRDSEVKRYIEENNLYQNIIPIQKNIDALKVLAGPLFDYHIVLMTSRRSWRVASIQSDTTYWLNKHKVPYDAILYGYDKAESIATRLKNVKPAFAIENSRKHAIDIADMGVKVYFVNPSGDKLIYNNIVSIADLSEIEEITWPPKKPKLLMKEKF